MRRIAVSQAPAEPRSRSTPRLAEAGGVDGAIPGKDSNTGAVARHFKQGETKRILLGTEYAADKPFLFLRHPITPPVLDDLEIVWRQYRLRREAGHTLSANAVVLMLY